MAEVSTSRQRWLSVAAFGLAMLAFVACSEEPTLPRVLSDAERPTAVEIERAPAVEMCELFARPTDYLDELVRVHARWSVGAIAPPCEGFTAPYLAFDQARIKRLGSSAALRSFNQLFRSDNVRGVHAPFEVVFLGRFTKRGGWRNEAPDVVDHPNQLLVYSIERVTALESAQPSR